MASINLHRAIHGNIREKSISLSKLNETKQELEEKIEFIKGDRKCFEL